MFLLFLLLFKYNVSLSKKKCFAISISCQFLMFSSWKKNLPLGLTQVIIIKRFCKFFLHSPQVPPIFIRGVTVPFRDGRGVLRSKRTSCRDVKSRSPWRQVMVQTPSPIPRRSVGFVEIFMLISAEIWGTSDGKHQMYPAWSTFTKNKLWKITMFNSYVDITRGYWLYAGAGDVLR